MQTSRRIPVYYGVIALWIERVLAVAILAGVLVFGVSSTQALLSMNWQAMDTFYDLVYRVLLLVIGVELARTLLTHELRAILELLAFVIARKMLQPDLGALDLLLSALAFVALLAANRFWLPPASGEDEKGRGGMR